MISSAGWNDRKSTTITINKPMTDKSISDKSISDKSISDKSISDKPISDKSISDKSISDKSISDKPISDKPMSDKPISDKSISDKSMSDKPMSDKPISDKPMTNKATNYFMILFIIAFFIRGVTVFYNTDSFQSDPDNYKRLAHNIADYGVFGTAEIPTAFRPPLYPLILCGMFSITVDEHRGHNVHSLTDKIRLSENAAIALLHWILGLATVLLTWKLALYLHLSEKGAFLAALLVAIDPILLQQSRLVMTETLAAFLSTLILVIPARFSDKLPHSLVFFFWGILLGLAVLCRPAFLVFVVLIFIGLPIFHFKNVSIGVFFILLIGLGVVLLPWTIRNSHNFHKNIFTTTHGGYTLLLANNNFLYDHYNKHYPWETVWDPGEYHTWYQQKLAQLKSEHYQATPAELELYQDKMAQEDALQVIKERPKDFIQSTIIRIGNLWQFLPYRTEETKSGDSSITKVDLARYAIGLFYLLEFLGLLVGIVTLFRKKKNKAVTSLWPSWGWIILLILSVQLPHLFYWTNMRMRAPLIVAVALLVSLSLKKEEGGKIINTMDNHGQQEIGECFLK